VGTSDVEPERTPAAGEPRRSGLGPALFAGLIESGLRYFLAVAQAGSITETSEQLHVAGSAISRQIARLEHEIGAPGAACAGPLTRQLAVCRAGSGALPRRRWSSGHPLPILLRNALFVHVYGLLVGGTSE
jgi:Bacterial regulatory helix-turn-helix protein, lysR family